MGFDASGTFTRYGGSTIWQGDAISGTKIIATRHDSHDQELANGLSECLTRTGKGAPTVDISWGGKKLVNLANPTAPQDAATKSYVDDASTAAAKYHGWEVIKQETVTTARAALEFKDLAPFRQLKLSGWILPETNDKHVIYQSSTNNGTSYDTGAEDYYSQYLWVEGGDAPSGVPDFYHGLLINGDTMPNDFVWAPGCSFVYDIFNFNQPFMNSCQTHAHNVRPAPDYMSIIGLNAGYRASTTPRNAFRVVADTPGSPGTGGNIAQAFYILEGIRG